MFAVFCNHQEKLTCSLTLEETLLCGWNVKYSHWFMIKMRSIHWVTFLINVIPLPPTTLQQRGVATAQTHLKNWTSSSPKAVTSWASPHRASSVSVLLSCLTRSSSFICLNISTYFTLNVSFIHLQTWRTFHLGCYGCVPFTCKRMCWKKNNQVTRGHLRENSSLLSRKVFVLIPTAAV